MKLNSKIKTIILILFISLMSGTLCDSVSLNVPEKDVTCKVTFRIAVKGHLDYLKLKIAVPHTIKDRQTLNHISYSIPPDSFYTVNSADYVYYKINNVNEDLKITIKAKLTIYNSIQASNGENPNDLNKYLLPETDIESNSANIISVANTLKEKSDIETVVKTFQFVKDNIHYEMKTAIGAEKVLESHVGKCMDFSDLFVALLRANKIPSKSMFGIVAEPDIENPLHAWPEVYLKKQGWVRFDPTTGHSEIESNGKNFVVEISNKYIVLGEGRNDPEFKVSPYKCFYKGDSTASVTVNPVFDIFLQ